MKLLATLGTLLLSAAACLPLSAQVKTIAYGRTTIHFNQNFQQTLSGLGASITDLNTNSLRDGAATFRVTSGVIDVQTAVGEVAHAGGYLISAGGATLVLQNFILDTSNPSSPVMTAVFSVNTVVQGRIPVFTVQPPASFALPLQPVAGTEEIDGFTLTLAPAAAGAINAVFGAEVLQAGVPVGSADVYTVLNPDLGII